MIFTRAWLCSLLLSVPAAAAELPPAVLPAGVGVNIHFTTGHGHDLDLIAAAGFKFIRMDFEWGVIEERKRGVYDWSRYDALTADLEKRGLRAIYILDYSNPLYEPQRGGQTPSPQHPRSVAAFARWAAAAARRYRGRHIIWEIYNEPNISFWRPKPDVRQYIALALATGRAVRAADPNATVIAPATSGVPLWYLAKVFASGLLKDLDAVSLHPYRAYDQPPEAAGRDYRNVRRLIRRYAPAGKKNLPIISSEWGYASQTGDGVSPDKQAAFLVRMQLANLLDHVPLSIWYDWKDDGTNRANAEQNFGTVHHDLQPKPAYRAVRTLTHELTGYRLVRRLELDNKLDYVLLLADKHGRQKVAAWTLGKPHELHLDDSLTAGEPNGVLGNGEPFHTRRLGGKLFLKVTGLPLYLSLPPAHRSQR